jgi:phage repressor protein C with HTH and peptisase S24 domain
MTTAALKLTLIRIEGDAMVPTLYAGDDVLVDLADGSEQLRDGIYAIRKNGPFIVRRIAINPITQRITVKSDNSAYPDWPDCRPADVGTVGRIIWFGRRMP